MLAEFGTTLGDDVEVRVWDSCYQMWLVGLEKLVVQTSTQMLRRPLLSGSQFEQTSMRLPRTLDAPSGMSHASAAGPGDTTGYYEHSLATLEVLATRTGLTTEAELTDRKAAGLRAAEATPHGQPIEL